MDINNNNTLASSNEYDELVKLYSKDLVDKELEIEAESQRIGINRKAKMIEADKANRGASGHLLSKAIPEFSKAIRDWLEAANSKGTAGRKHSAACLISLGDPDMIAYITLSTTLSCLLSAAVSKHYSLSVVATKVANAIEDEFRFNRVLDGLSKKDASHIKSGLDKRIGLSYKRAFIRSIETTNVESGKLEAWEKWTASAKLNVGTKLIELAAESTGMFDLVLLADSTGNRVYQLYIKDEVLNAIDSENELLISLGFINRPMVIPPKPWTAPFDGGYYIDLKAPSPFIRMPKGKLKSMYSDVEMNNVYLAVNIIQATPWHVNGKVLDVANAVSEWVNIPSCLNFPSKLPSEPPIRPDEADTDPEVHSAWKGAMLRYYQLDNTRKGKRLGINALLALASDYRDYDGIYFPHNIDFRGRVYPLTILSPQGSDFGKSLLEFAHGKPVGETGAKWLAFHGANCYGLDKRPMQERFDWPYQNEGLITKIASDPLNNTEWMEADSPWEFLAWCFEWAEFLKQGTSFVSKLPIAFDGSCSGLQHYSAMLRDPIGGKAVNLLPSDTVQDIYSLVKDEVIKIAEQDAKEGTADSLETDDHGNQYTKYGTKALAKEWLALGITRIVTKRPVMTLAYGSKRFGFKDQILSDVIYPAMAKDANAFKRPNQAATYMAGLIWDSVHKVVVKAMEAMEWLQEASALLAAQKGLNGEAIPTYWITPAGFPVYQAYEKVKMKQLHTVLGSGIKIRDPLGLRDNSKADADGNVTIYPSLKETLTGTIDPRKQRQGIAPNFVHSMDASHLMLTVIECRRKGVTNFAMIHDSYGTCAADADTMYHTVREVFVKTYSENDVLRNIYEQVKLQLPSKAASKLPEPPTKGTLDLNAVLESKYAFS